VAKPNVLTLGHRQVLEANWAAGKTVTELAGLLGVAVSTISRELQRYHSSRHGVKNPLRLTLTGRARRPYLWGYLAERAHKRAQAAQRRRKGHGKLMRPGRLRQLVVAKLRKRWSPRQISRWLAREFPDQPEYRVSHETIYQALYVQSRNNLRAELTAQVALRSGRVGRKVQSRATAATRASRRPWIGDLHISTRPAEAADRAVPGHWEGDLLIGTRNASAIVTLVERSNRYVMLGALPDGYDSRHVIDVLSQLAHRMPAHLRRSLTWDQGAELARHVDFTVATGCPVYFCDPHSPWQRGSNENTNGLLRQYFAKGRFDFRTIDQAGLDAVAHELNGRPRQTLDWRSPSEALADYYLTLHAA
jgi:IS30 family transposase